MSKQNIYDNYSFFEGYKHIRDNEANANILIEKPALLSMLPDLKGKRLLDLGCGYGENCVTYIKNGAREVVGIDISEKMLEVAHKDHKMDEITFKNMSMEDIMTLDGNFDCIVSSLAVHYLKDFDKLVNDVFQLLNSGGYFIFSQENPINTSFSVGDRWTKDENDNVICANLYNYSIDGERKSTWFVDNVVKYHRTFSSIINSLVSAGFIIDQFVEPVPSKEIMEKYPTYNKEIHKPNFLLIKVHKEIQ